MCFFQASVTALDNTGKNTLHYCVENDSTKIAVLVLKADKGLVDTRDNEGYTPLHLAVIASNELMIKFLIKNGAKLNSIDNEGHNVIHWATGKYYMVQVI